MLAVQRTRRWFGPGDATSRLARGAVVGNLVIAATFITVLAL